MEGCEQNQIGLVNSGRRFFFFPIVVICKWPHCVETCQQEEVALATKRSGEYVKMLTEKKKKAKATQHLVICFQRAQPNDVSRLLSNRVEERGVRFFSWSFFLCPLMALPHYRPRQKPPPHCTASSWCLLYSCLPLPFDNSHTQELDSEQIRKLLGTQWGLGVCFEAYFSALKVGNCDYWRWDVSHAVLCGVLTRPVLLPFSSESRDQWYAQIEKEGRNMA